MKSITRQLFVVSALLSTMAVGAQQDYVVLTDAQIQEIQVAAQKSKDILQTSTFKADANKRFEIGFYLLPAKAGTTYDMNALKRAIIKQVENFDAAIAQAGGTNGVAVSFIEEWPFPSGDVTSFSGVYATIGANHRELARQHIDGTETDAAFLVTDLAEGNINGLAALASPSSYVNAPTVMYLAGALTYQGILSDELLVAHEAGHLLGMQHDKANAGGGVSYLEPDAFGYNCESADGRKGTIMSYERPNHKFYSTPDISVNGKPCGVLGEANNARVLRQNLPLAVNTKVGTSVVTTADFSSTGVAVEENTGTIKVTVQRMKADKAGAVLVQFATDAYQTDFVERDVLVNFEVGQFTAEASFTIKQDTTPESEKTFKLTLADGINAMAGTQTEFTITLRDTDTSNNGGNNGGGNTGGSTGGGGGGGGSGAALILLMAAALKLRRKN